MGKTLQYYSLTPSYRFIDYATQGYVAVVGLLVLGFHGGKVGGWGWLVGAHVVCLGVVHGIIRWHARRPGNPVAAALRHFYPILLYTFLYAETGHLNQMFTGRTEVFYADAVFLRLEQQLFGCQPTLALMERMPWLWLSELLYASYFSYYFMIFGVGLALFLRDRRQFFHYVSVVSFVFYFCYLVYIFFPVVGRPIFFEEITGHPLPPEVLPAEPHSYPASVQVGPFYQLMAFIYDRCETPGAAFPSSHVAVALCTVYFSFRYLRPIRYVHLTVAVLLCIATVYCRYHYVVDVLAGALTTLVLVPIANRLCLRFPSGTLCETESPPAQSRVV